MTSRSIDEIRCSPANAAWWGRLLVASFFAFYLNYVPIHLASVAHLNALFVSVAVIHDDDHADGGHHDDADHVPHPASDHTLNVAPQTHAPGAVALAVLCVVADTSILIDAPQPQQRISVFERVRPPGESPPDPLQPRAPPLA